MSSAAPVPPGHSSARDALHAIRGEVAKAIVGQDAAVSGLVVALLCQGHVLLEGVPGVAKTLLVRTLSATLSLKFKRIQFTPDLMPSDITGTDIIEEDPETGRRELTFFPGPVFANIILADEINRTPPKTQAAMLQAMQEREVTVGTKTNKLEAPFLVLATQNPIEQEGTYPLPEAQQDRFMFNIYIGYPDEAEETQIGLTTTRDEEPQLNTILTGADIVRYQSLVRKVPVAEHVAKYATHLVRATRPFEASGHELAKKWIQWGAGPRAIQYLLIAGKARAILQGRPYVSTEDVRKSAISVLRHRLVPNFAAEAEGMDTVRIVQDLVKAVPEPKE